MFGNGNSFSNDELLSMTAYAVAMERVGEPIPVDLALALGNAGMTIDALEGITDLFEEVEALVQGYHATGDFIYPDEEAFDFDFDGSVLDGDFDNDGAFADYLDYPIGGTE
jgi:hypothetical protein